MSVTAPIVKFGSKQKSDIAASLGPTDILDDMYRAKEYVKEEHRNMYASARSLAFDQPWQWASEIAVIGYKWGNDSAIDPSGIDKVFLGQLAGCNLECDECFAHGNTEIENVTPKQYVDAFERYQDLYGKCYVMRISGGEPMLYPEWVWGVIDESSCTDGLRWIDTNLTKEIPNYLLRKLNREHTAVCGCFKPNRRYRSGASSKGLGIVDIGDQLGIVQSIIDADVSLFLYWPAWDKEASPALFNDTLDKLRKIDPYLPLRLTVIETKRYAASPNMDGISSPMLEDVFNKRRSTHFEYLKRHYHSSLIAMPSHYTLSLGRK